MLFLGLNSKVNECFYKHFYIFVSLILGYWDLHAFIWVVIIVKLFLIYRKVASTNASRFVTRLVFKHTQNDIFKLADRMRSMRTTGASKNRD